MIETLMTETVVFSRTTSLTRDGIGGSQPGTQTTLTVKCYLEPVSGLEDQQDRNTQIGDWLCVVPAGTDVDGWDRAEARGRSFDITAPPKPFVEPFSGTEHHQEIGLREVKP